MFCSSEGSSVRANVPMSASVAITPRTRSLSTAPTIALPIGSSTRKRHAAASPTSALASSRVISGDVNVGHSFWVTTPQRR